MSLFVEFVHSARAKKNAASMSMGGIHYEATALSPRGKVARLVLLVVSVCLMALGARRAEFSMGQSLCLFAGLMPVFWLISSFIGLFWSMKKVPDSAPEIGSSVWQKKVALSANESRIRVTLGDEFEVKHVNDLAHEVQLNQYSSVSLVRIAEQVTIMVKNEEYVIPLVAFENAQAFDDFCISLQGKIWAAQRTKHP